MAVTGSSADILSRVVRLLPPRGFNQTAPIRDAVLGGIADALSSIYSQIAFAKAQSRLQTSTGIFVDIFGFDYLANEIQRRSGESDAAYVARIQREIFRERVTRDGISDALEDLTGFAPTIFEPFNTGDCGALEIGTFALSGGGVGGAGRIGSTDLPNQFFVQAFYGGFIGVPGIAGLSGSGAYGGAMSGSGLAEGGTFALINMLEITGAVTPVNIYTTINNAKATGVSPWVQIEVTPQAVTNPLEAEFSGQTTGSFDLGLTNDHVVVGRDNLGFAGSATDPSFADVDLGLTGTQCPPVIIGHPVMGELFASSRGILSLGLTSVIAYAADDLGLAGALSDPLTLYSLIDLGTAT